MKVLTLWQPWASLIAEGEKWIETRSWSTTHRGLIAIHAAAREPDTFIPVRGTPVLPLGSIIALCSILECFEIATYAFEDGDGFVAHEDGGLAWHMRPGPEEQMRNERYLIRDVTSQAPYGDFTPGRFAWILGDIRKVVPPVPAKGHQRLWEWP